jgi:hypothetical protein
MTRTLHVQIGNSPDRTDLESALETVDEQAVESRSSTMVFEDLERSAGCSGRRISNCWRRLPSTNPQASLNSPESSTGTRPRSSTTSKNSGNTASSNWKKRDAKRLSIWYDEIEADLPPRQSTP